MGIAYVLLALTHDRVFNGETDNVEGFVWKTNALSWPRFKAFYKTILQTF